MGIIKFGERAVVPEHYRPASGKRLDGNPQQTVWTHYTDSSGRFSAGIWGVVSPTRKIFVIYEPQA